MSDPSVTPCPRCASAPQVQTDYGRAHVECPACGYRGPDVEAHTEGMAELHGLAATAWNRATSAKEWAIMTDTDLDDLILDLLSHGPAVVGLLRDRIALRIGAMATPKAPAVTGRLRALEARSLVRSRHPPHSDRVPRVWSRV